MSYAYCTGVPRRSRDLFEPVLIVYKRKRTIFSHRVLINFKCLWHDGAVDENSCYNKVENAID